MLRGILFDMFGTLVGYNPSRTEQGYHATHDLLRANGIDVTYETFLACWSAVWDRLEQETAQSGWDFSMERLASEFLSDLGCLPDERLTTDITRSYVREWSTGVRPIPGVPELLAEFAPRFRLGVVSNTHSARAVHDELKRGRIHHYFPVIVTSIEHGRRKPNPSIFEAALARLDLPPSEVLFIGDNLDADYRGANGAGMSAVLIDPTGTHRTAAQHTVRSILELRDCPLLKPERNERT